MAINVGSVPTKTETGLNCNTSYTRYVWAYSACGVSAPATITATTTVCVPTACLTGHWPFNGNANDATGNGNNGVIYGTTLANDRFGNPDKAYSFNGTDNYIVVPDSPGLALSGNLNSDFTLSAWVNTANTPLKQGIAGRWGGTSGIRYLLFLLENGTGSLHATTVGTPFQGGSIIPSNEWHFLVGSYNSATNQLNLYLNGNQNKSVSATNIFGTNPDSTKNFEIGRFDSNYYFIGKIEDIRLYSCALNQAEIGALYNEGAVPPTVSTSAASNITQTSASCGGNVTSSGGTAITARGICYGSDPNPTISGPHTTEPNGTGVFTSTLSGLANGTSYYFRAYATNSIGTVYGSTNSFSTLSATGQPCNGLPLIIDPRDGQVYPTVQIGTQCWFAKNLNVGVMINSVATPTTPIVWPTNNGIIEKYCLNNLEENCNVWGGWYQGKEAMQYVYNQGAQGICPPGWHLPTQAEWNTLKNYLDPYAGGKLKEAGLAHWGSPNNGATNSSGFTALGSSFYSGSATFNCCLGVWTTFWGSTLTGSSWEFLVCGELHYSLANFSIAGEWYQTFRSVRCLKNLVP